ncbi:conserved protein of unknown function [Candidatus Nitrosocosmicus franklandus]|uniref:Uncharacterized protein n=1 Tax=Candidatus Nitrosocosmicus franklandianus TaxID=1798806 RepID=A0A484IBZ3_9ARCH|nr:conserved protein of unknown function [Candidatus Nitrosocosmicus franklandus]
MIWSRKKVVLLSIFIVIASAVIIGLLAPSAYLNLCKQKADEIADQLYAIEGGRDEFPGSLKQQNLSSEAQKELQTLNSVIAQCHELEADYVDGSLFGLKESQINNNNNNDTINQV